MSRLEETRHLIESAAYPYNTSNIKAALIRILDHLIAQEQAASPKDEMAEAWIAWEDLQRDHNALRAELDAAKKRIAELTKWQSDAQKEIDTWCKRALDAEAYKARVEALPVLWNTSMQQHGRFIPEKVSVKFADAKTGGRFIPAGEEP